LHLALSVRAAILKQRARAISGGKIMLQNAVAEVAIGLILMYLMLSLLCTAINEFIATKLSIRATTLRDTLQKLIDDPTLLTNFYEHGLIASNFQASGTGSQSMLQVAANLVGAPGLLKNQVAAPKPAAAAAGSGAGTAPAAGGETEHPSYLASGTVALAIMGSLLKQTPGAAADITGVQSAIAALPDSKIKDALAATALKAGDDIKKLEKGIATWFDDSMDRLSGAYKRKLKWIAMLIGLVIAIAFNADSFKVAATLWNDPDRRASTIAVATDIAKNNLAELEQGGGRKQPGGAAPPAGQKQPDGAAPPDAQKQPPGGPPPGGPTQPGNGAKSGSNGPGEAIEKTEHVLRSLPIGWSCPEPGPGKTFHYWTCAEDELSKLTLVQLLGWILTAAALSLGAPFWFDMLNKFINLRGAGGKPVREDQKT
jgi:hypothetical protein